MSKSVRVNEINLKDVGGYVEMTVNFNPRLNVICGPNGVGKTTLLDAVGSLFVTNYMVSGLRRRASSNLGKIKYMATIEGVDHGGVGSLSNFNPTDQASPYGIAGAASSVIYIKSNRDFSYSSLNGLMKDPDKDDHNSQNEASNGISVFDVKQWFSNRYLMSPHGDKWPSYRKDNLKIANNFFSYLDNTVSLSHVDSSSFDVLLNTKSGIIPFEYMSAGFRASYSLMLGILKEIEFRKLEVSADNFCGLILVDELDLHLHPTWHRPMLEGLEQAFPNAQIIVTTHSPHMIQSTKKANLVVLPRNGNRPLELEGIDDEYGFMGWSVEEILRDVMGMDDPRPPKFIELMSEYENAVTRGDRAKTSVAKKKIQRALHPSSVLRQIIEIDSI